MVFMTSVTLVSLILWIFKFHCSLGSNFIPPSQSSAPNDSFLPNCNLRIREDLKCLFVPTDALNWEEAHSFCRREGGFLSSAGDLNDLTQLGYEEIWTALTYTDNQYQWRSRNTAFAGDTFQGKDGTTSGFWNSPCLVYRIQEKKFKPSGCEEEKQFVCILNRRLEFDSEDHPNNLELRVSANIMPNEVGWIEVSLQTFDDLKLKCSVIGSSMKDLSSQSYVNWKKNGISIPYHNSTLQPSKIPHFSKPIFLDLLPSSNSSRALAATQQGTYCCEMWIPFSTEVKRSNCVLVTLKNMTTLILKVILEAPEPVHELIAKVKSSLGENPVIVPEIKKNGAKKINYQVHVENVDIEIIKNVATEISKEGSGIGLFEAGSGVAIATHCLEKNVTFKHGNEMLLPFTKAGAQTHSPYKCANRDNELLHPLCQWNFTEGATVEPTSKNLICNICPKGFMIIGNRLCTKIIKNVTWDEGFSQLYATGNERTIFDGASYLDRATGVKNVSYHNLLLDYLKDNEVTKVRLLIRRKYPITSFVDHTIRYSYNQTFLLNARKDLVKMDWVKNHPQADKQCASLDVTLEGGFLTSDECEERNNFITFVDVAELLSNSSFLRNDPRLCPEGWNRVILSKKQQICVKFFRDQVFRVRTHAEAFCTLQGARLVDPCRGFMFWILRGFLKKNEKVWISPTQKTCDWLPDYYFSNKYVLSHEGFEYGDGKYETLYSTICEKKVAKYSVVKLSLMKKPELAKKWNYSNPICLRAKPFPLIGNFSLTCLKNGAVIQPYFPKSKKCLCVIDMDEKGFYECSVWSNFPLMQVWSPVFFNKDEKVISYVVIGSESGLTYNPIYYDSTFYQIYHRKKFEPSCLNIIFKLINNDSKSIDNNFTNVYFSQNNGTFQYSFHMQCKELFLHMCSSKENVEMGLKQALRSGPKAAINCAIVEVKTVLGCPEETSYSQKNLLTWPGTDGAGIFLPKEHCVLSDGQPISRKCDGSFMTGFYWRPAPTTGCPMKPTNDTINLWRLRCDSKRNFSAMTQLTSKSAFLNAADLVNVAYAMRSSAKAYSKLSFNEVVSTMNNIMGSNESVLTQGSENFYATSIALKSFETLAFYATEDMEKMTVNKKRLMVSVFNISLTTSVTGFQWADSNNQPILNESKVDLPLVYAAIKLPQHLPSAALSSNFEEYDSQLLFALYKDTNVFLDNETVSSGYRIGSHVIQSTFRRIEVNNYLLGEDKFITLTFRPTQVGSDIKCVFWDFKKNANKGGWSSKGCHLVELKDGLVTCNCSHLTSFAVIMKGSPINKKHEYALSLLSIIGCTLSAIGLACVLLTFACFKKFRNSLDNKIFANLSVAILMSLLIFLFGIDRTQFEIVCECVAILLTYFIFASFGWMLVEAIHNYQKFVKVYSVYIPNFIWMASIFAWGMPVLPIGVLFALNGGLHDNEIDSSICWMSTRSFFYTFVPYVSIILVINIITYIMIINSTILRRARLTSTLDQRKLIVSQICMATCIFFLLGFTWIFGFLSYIHETVVFAYLFCICNTLQGFVIFFFRIYRNRKVRELWFGNRKAIRLSRLLRLPDRSRRFLRKEENELTTNNIIQKSNTDPSLSNSIEPNQTSSTRSTEDLT